MRGYSKLLGTVPFPNYRICKLFCSRGARDYLELKVSIDPRPSFPVQVLDSLGTVLI